MNIRPSNTSPATAAPPPAPGAAHDSTVNSGNAGQEVPR